MDAEPSTAILTLERIEAETLECVWIVLFPFSFSSLSGGQVMEISASLTHSSQNPYLSVRSKKWHGRNEKTRVICTLLHCLMIFFGFGFSWCYTLPFYMLKNSGDSFGV